MNNDDTYHLALGQFVDAFATAEHNLKFALAATAKISRETAQAPFSNTRVDGVIELIRRLYEAEGSELGIKGVSIAFVLHPNSQGVISFTLGK